MDLLAFKVSVALLFIFGSYYILKQAFTLDLSSEFDCDPEFKKEMLLQELKELNYQRLQAELSGDIELEDQCKKRIKELEDLIY
jgi:hypothetical protein